MKTIETEILIHSSAEKIWKILTDFESHSTWNPFIKSISGEKEKGKILTVLIHPPGGSPMKFKPEVLAFEENREFRWKGKLGFPGIFDGEHYFILEELEPEKTRFIHGEKFSGILVPILGGMLKHTEGGFKEMNEKLKQKCEKL